MAIDNLVEEKRTGLEKLADAFQGIRDLQRESVARMARDYWNLMQPYLENAARIGPGLVKGIVTGNAKSVYKDTVEALRDWVKDPHIMQVDMALAGYRNALRSAREAVDFYKTLITGVGPANRRLEPVYAHAFS